MATSKELLILQELGAEIRIIISGEPTGGLVEYSPQYKGDRKPWAYRDGTSTHWYAASECGVVPMVRKAVKAPVVETPAADAKPGVTQEMIEALRTLRVNVRSDETSERVAQALVILDNAGVFAAIDAAADAKQAPVSTDEYVQCGHCRGDYKPKADGTLRKHACWHYDKELNTVVFGPLDIHGRRKA